MYRVFLPSFRDAFGDGLSGLQGVIDALPYLSELLNVDALWISSPISVRGRTRAVDAALTDLAVLERLVAVAHGRGLRVIVDDTVGNRDQAETLGWLRMWLERGIDGIAFDPTGEQQRDRLPRIGSLLAEYGDRVVIVESESAAASGRSHGPMPRAEEPSLAVSRTIIDESLTTKAVGATIAQIDREATAGLWPVNLLGGHERLRVSTRLGDAGARLAALLLLTLPGTPAIYCGDELGLTNAPAARATGQPVTRSAGARESSPAQVPWSVERQLRDHGSMLTLYRRLIDVRRLRAPLRAGSLRQLPVDAEDCLLLERRFGDSRLVVALNLTARERTVSIPHPQPRILVSTAIVPHSEVTGSDLILGGHVGVVLECR